MKLKEQNREKNQSNIHVRIPVLADTLPQVHVLVAVILAVIVTAVPILLKNKTIKKKCRMYIIN